VGREPRYCLEPDVVRWLAKFCFDICCPAGECSCEGESACEVTAGCACG